MGKKNITKGMILAAGLGTRLLPITERYPKPLVPVLNLANILHTVSLFRRHGISDIVINLFHLPERIEEFFNEVPQKDFRVSFSKEPVLLGTGGGVKRAESFFNQGPFVLANCDFISNLNLTHLIESHSKSAAWATMALIEDPAKQKLYSAVGTNEQGFLCSLPRKKTAEPSRQGIFTGVHVLEPEIFSFLEERPSGINDVLYPTLMENHPDKARGVFMEKAYWFDTGDIPALWQTSQALLGMLENPDNPLLEAISGYGPVYREVAPKVWTTQRTKLPENLKVSGPCLIGEGCQFEEGVEIGAFSVIGDRVLIGGGSKIEKSVVLSHSQVGSHQAIRESLFFEGRAFSALPNSSRS
ncbi:MAG: NDP-sugar synthase [Proteobacteria bacterium]|nr:NDP-sugar synthase [Pseudomonadota bacterium]